jgi:hypothetical protein
MRFLSVTGYESGHGFPEPKGTFWKRQSHASGPQIIYDILFGMVGPILCFVFDLIVFRGGMAGGALFPRYQIYVYLFSGLQIVLLGLWLLSGTGYRSLNDAIGGALICGGVFCLGAGLVLLPFSLMGLAFGVGLFGFTPFLNAFVYLRNGARAFHHRRRDLSIATRASALLIACLVVLIVPVILGATIQKAVRSSVDEIISGDPQHAIAAAHRLTPLRFFVGSECERLVRAYIATNDPARKEFLKDCYQEITGESIEERIRILND